MKKLTFILNVFIVPAVALTNFVFAADPAKIVHGKAESWMGPDGILVVKCTGGVPDICYIVWPTKGNQLEVHVSGSKSIVEDIIQVSSSTENNLISETFKLITK